MPAALPIDTRRAIVERRQQGESFRNIAEALGVSYGGVRHIWQHWQAHDRLAQRCAAAIDREIEGLDPPFLTAVETTGTTVVLNRSRRNHMAEIRQALDLAE